MSPKIVDKEKKKQEIALKALDVFAEQGFETASISDIAKHARIAKGAVYDYFKSKDELIFASLMAWMESLDAEARPIFEKARGPREMLLAWARAWTSVALSDPRTAKMMMMMPRLVMSKRFQRHQKLMRGMMEQSLHEVVGIIEKGVAKGVFRREVKKDAMHIALNMHAYLDGIMLHYLMMKDFIDIERNIDVYIGELITAISVPAGAGKDRKK